MIKKSALILSVLFIFACICSQSMANDKVEQAIGNLNSSNNNTRMEGIRILTTVDSGRSTEGLIAGLNNMDETIRYLSIFELSKRAKESETSNRAIEGLIAGLNNQDSDIRLKAVKGLAEINTARSTEGLISALNCPDISVQMVSIYGLAERAKNTFTAERAIEGLISALDNSNTEIRITSVKALSDVKAERAKEGLKKALNDPDSKVKVLAKRGLTRYE
ncbi:MAG: HEAT repeat domain-containing protein [Cyanobacteriota bacterium]